MKPKIVLAGIVLFAAGIAAGYAWHVRHPSLAARNHAELQRVADKYNEHMPRFYVDELVMERAYVDGNRLIFDIHIPDIALKEMDPKKIPLIRAQEQNDLDQAACTDPDFASLTQHKAEVARRFLDRDRKAIFEIVAAVSQCNHAGAL